MILSYLSQTNSVGYQVRLGKGLEGMSYPGCFESLNLTRSSEIVSCVGGEVSAEHDPNLNTSCGH